MEFLGLLTNRSQHVQHSVFIHPTQSGRSPDSYAFGQAANDLNDFGFIQTEIGKAFSFVECPATGCIETAKALNQAGFSFVTTEFLCWIAAA